MSNRYLILSNMIDDDDDDDINKKEVKKEIRRHRRLRPRPQRSRYTADHEIVAFQSGVQRERFQCRLIERSAYIPRPPPNYVDGRAYRNIPRTAAPITSQLVFSVDEAMRRFAEPHNSFQTVERRLDECEELGGRGAGPRERKPQSLDRVHVPGRPAERRG